MEDIGEDRERIPEKYKNHCMIGKYEYERIDKETGKDCLRIFCWERYNCFINICVWLKADLCKGCY